MLFSRFITTASLILAVSFVSARGAQIGPFTGPEADAEAARLYEHANDFVNHVDEGEYSYAYIQFHWKRAGSNIARILRAYPDSPTAREIRAGALQVGSFEPEYFRERVLPRLEEKKVGSFDAINSAIFLYYLADNHDQSARRELLSQIIITLCRQKRWGEALNFPVLAEGAPWLWRIVARMASNEGEKIADELVLNTAEENLPALYAVLAESRAFRGDTPTEIEDFLFEHRDNQSLQADVFRGLVRRETAIQHALLLKEPLDGIFDGVDEIKKPEQSTDLAAFLATMPAGPDLQRARRDYARYLASLGRLDEARTFATPADQAGLAASFATYLITREEYEQTLTLARSFRLTGPEAIQFHLQLLELLAQAGRENEVAAVRQLIPAPWAAQAVYHEWRGRILSTENQLVVREHTFASIPLSDPNLLGRLVCEWSLTPNRYLRGAAPWDDIVYKFAPGFTDLPPPEDPDKVEAAGR